MKKKIVLKGIQCDACGRVVDTDFWHNNESVFKISMAGNPAYQMRDKMHLCPMCAHSLHSMILDWYNACQSRRTANEERYEAMLAKEKKVKE